MANSACVSEQDLRAFVLGELPERIDQWVTAHLEGCRACELAAQRLDTLVDPALAALRVAARRLGLACATLAVVGDDPALEVPMAHRGGALAIAVHSGLGGADAFDVLPPDARPHWRERQNSPV